MRASRAGVALIAALLVLSVGACGDGGGEDASPATSLPAATLEGWEGGTFSAEIEELLGEDDLPDSYLGRWQLTLTADAYIIETEGFRVSGRFALQGDRAIFDDDPAPAGAFNCFVHGERTFTEGAGTYSWRLGGGRLHLEAVDEPCPFRASLLERAWQQD